MFSTRTDNPRRKKRNSQTHPRQPRRRPLCFEPLEERVCLSLFLGNFFGNEVLEFDETTGATIGVFGEANNADSGLEQPAGVLFGPDGNLYVTNEGLNTISRFDGQTGAFLGDFGQANNTDSGLTFPNGLIFGHDGDLFVASAGHGMTSSTSPMGAVLRFDGTTGAFKGIFGEAHFNNSTLRVPIGLTFGPDGDLYVASAGGLPGNIDPDFSAILRYDGTTGAFKGTFGDTDNAGSGLGRPQALTFGPDGNLYVSSTSTDEVLRYNGTTGAFLGVFGEANNTDSGLTGTEGLIFGPGGDLFVTRSRFNILFPPPVGTPPPANFEDVLRYDGQTGQFLGVFADAPSLNLPTHLVFTNTHPTTRAYGVQSPVVVLPIADLTVPESAPPRLNYANMNAVFSDPDHPDSELVYTVVANKPAGIVTAVIEPNDTLDLSFVARAAGVVNITVRATDPDLLFVDHTFQVTVTSNNMSQTGGLFVTSFVSGVVLKLDETTGGSNGVFGEANPADSGLENPVGVLFGPHGDLYVTNEAQNYVARYGGQSGDFIGVFGEANNADSGLIFPNGMIFGPDGDLFVSSAGHGMTGPTSDAGAILRFDGTTGDFEGAFGDALFTDSALRVPIGLVFGPDGDLYVASAGHLPGGADADFEDFSAILRYDGTTGVFEGVFGDANFEDSGLLRPQDLIFGPDNDLYVTSSLTDEVLRYDGDTGAFLGVFGDASLGDSGLTGPRGLLFGPGGNLYVNSGFSGEVLRYNGDTGQFLGPFAVTVPFGGASHLVFTNTDPTTRAYENPDVDNTAGLYDPVAGTFFLKNSNAAGVGDVVFRYGPAGAGWTPLVGDWDGDGDDTPGLFDPVSGKFFLKNSNTAGVGDVVFRYGPAGAGWTPLVGDWDGDGDDTVGLFDPASGKFFLKNSNTAGVGDVVFRFGPAGAGWIPVIGDWDGNENDTAGLYDPAGGRFFLKNSNTVGVADVLFRFGPAGAGWLPLVGNWQGPSAPGLSEDFEGHLNQWTGRGGFAHRGQIVNDPLGASNRVLNFSGLFLGGDVFSSEIDLSNHTGPFVLSFDYLGLAEPDSNPGDLGGFLGISSTLVTTHPIVDHFWLAGTDPAFRFDGLGFSSVELIDDDNWHHYEIDFTTIVENANLTFIRIIIEDFILSDGVAGDAYFDNVRLDPGSVQAASASATLHVNLSGAASLEPEDSSLGPYSFEAQQSAATARDVNSIGSPSAGSPSATAFDPPERFKPVLAPTTSSAPLAGHADLPAEQGAIEEALVELMREGLLGILRNPLGS